MNTDETMSTPNENPEQAAVPETGAAEPSPEPAAVQSSDAGDATPAEPQAAEPQGEAAPAVAEAAAPSGDAPAEPAKADEAHGDDDGEDDDDAGNAGNAGNRPGWEEQPGDDIGNRTGAAAAAPAGEGAAEGSPAKKRRRRRKKKHGAEGAEGATAEGEGHADGEAHAEGEGEGDAEGEGGHDEEGKPRRVGKGAPPPRERPAFSIGEEVFGKVCRVSEDAVWIDIAGKATGLFDRRELMDEEPPVDGDQFIATVASTGARGGMLMLSRLPIILEETRKALEAAAQSGEAVQGFVTGAVKGGLEIDLGGLRAFAPASHVDMRHGADLHYLVGRRLDFVVTQYAKKGRDVVVSRRRMIEEEAKKLRAEAMTKVEEGSIHKGIVRKVVAWGAFVSLPDAGDLEGLIHMTEASHDRGARLSDLFKPNAEIEVKVLRVDEKGKLWLSRKALLPDPWDSVLDRYPQGSRHKGKVARLQPFGAFIELESGVDGLIHTADLSIAPIEHPSEVVKVDDEIEVVVVSCDPGNHKIGLHPAPPPGEEVEVRQRVVLHKSVKCAVSQVVEGGIIVRILGVTGRQARGFIPAGHSGTARGTDLRKEFKLGAQLEAKVLEIDPRRGEAKLSIRALKDDGEKQAYQQYRAVVARESKFGTFADLMKKST